MSAFSSVASLLSGGEARTISSRDSAVRASPVASETTLERIFDVNWGKAELGKSAGLGNAMDGPGELHLASWHDLVSMWVVWPTRLAAFNRIVLISSSVRRSRT